MTDRIEKRLVKLQILVTDSELASIDDWRFVNRSDNRSSAVRELMAIGLEMTSRVPKTCTPSSRASGSNASPSYATARIGAA